MFREGRCFGRRFGFGFCACSWETRNSSPTPSVRRRNSFVVVAEWTTSRRPAARQHGAPAWHGHAWHDHATSRACGLQGADWSPFRKPESRSDAAIEEARSKPSPHERHGGGARIGPKNLDASLRAREIGCDLPSSGSDVRNTMAGNTIVRNATCLRAPGVQCNVASYILWSLPRPYGGSRLTPSLR